MRRHFFFRRHMLGGLDGKVTRAVKRVIVRGVNHGLIVTSTTGGRHAATSYHYAKPRGKAVDFGNRLRELMERSHRADVELQAVETERRHVGQLWLDATVSAHSIEASEEEDLEAPLVFNVEGLMEQWDPEEAELVLNSYSDPEAEVARSRRLLTRLASDEPPAPW